LQGPEWDASRNHQPLDRPLLLVLPQWEEHASVLLPALLLLE
jgi:hypothetical protein